MYKQQGTTGETKCEMENSTKGGKGGKTIKSAIKASTECSICCNNFNKNKYKGIKCRSCDIEICRTCVRTYVLNNHDEPHCMSCKNIWPKEFYTTHLLKSFINGKYKEHKITGLFNTEVSQIPNTMPAVKTYKRLKELDEKMDEKQKIKRKIRERLKKLDLDEYYIRRQMNDLKKNTTTDTEKKSFTQPCPSKDCRGYLSTKWKCESCSKETCSKCFIIKDEDEQGNETKEEHVCKQENIASVELIRKETKSCPTCGTNIFKISGCDQMWCVECHIAFSWRTGKKVNGVVHNPHFYEWQKSEQSTQRINPPRAIMCGGLPQSRDYLRLINSHISSGKYNLEDEIVLNKAKHIHQRASHIAYYELDGLRTACTRIQDNEDIRVKYILKEINEKKFKSLIIQRNSKYEKNKDTLNIYELVNTVLIESIRDMYESLSSIKSDTTSNCLNIIYIINKNLNRYNSVKKYANDELNKISYLHNNSIVKKLDKDFHTYSSSWSSGDAKPIEDNKDSDGVIWDNVSEGEESDTDSDTDSDKESETKSKSQILTH